jgi:hypothetical protein
MSKIIYVIFDICEIEHISREMQNELWIRSLKLLFSMPFSYKHGRRFVSLPMSEPQPITCDQATDHPSQHRGQHRERAATISNFDNSRLGLVWSFSLYARSPAP